MCYTRIVALLKLGRKNGDLLWRMRNRYVLSVPFLGSVLILGFFQCIKVNPNWGKGYARKGAALHGARKYDEAIAAYETGLKFEDNAALRKGLKEVQDAKGKLSLIHLVVWSLAESLSL